MNAGITTILQVCVLFLHLHEEDPNSTYSNTQFRFHGGAGLAFYPFRHLGLFTVYGYDNHVINGLDHWIWEFGLVYKFRGRRGE